METQDLVEPLEPQVPLDATEIQVYLDLLDLPDLLDLEEMVVTYTPLDKRVLELL